MRAVSFDQVSKQYLHPVHMNAGFKGMIINRLRGKSQAMSVARFALNDVSFTIEQGESVAVMGHNGSGKSTLLSLVAGVMHPTSGTVTVQTTVAPLLELGSGFHHELNGHENIRLNTALLGMTNDEYLKMRDSIIDFSGIAERLAEPLRTYSTGMVARLALSIALHLDRGLILIDEILGVGDAEFQSKALARIIDSRARGATIMYVGHGLELARSICERGLVLRAGKLICDSAFDEAATRYLGRE
jgi:lipopolysaccharide transport system ATP-binding protein